MSRRFGPAHEARLPDRIGREVVVVDVAPLLLAGEVVDLLPLLHRAERQQRQDLRLSAREEGRAVRPWRHGDIALDVPDLLLGATVGAALLDRDLLADEVLVHRLGGPLHELLRHGVLDLRLALGGRRADRERERELLEDAVVEEVTLRRAELLRVLLGVRQLAQVVEELLPHRALDRGQPRLLEDRREARPHLRAAGHVVLGRGHRDLRRRVRDELVDDDGRLAEPVRGDRGAHGLAVRRLELGGELERRPTSACRPARAGPRAPRRSCGSPPARARTPRGSVSSGTWSAPASTIVSASLVPTTMRSSVELLELLERGVDDELALDLADPDGPDRDRGTAAATPSRPRTRR